MHKNFKVFSYPFKAHAVVHHQIFKADETYHLTNPKDLHTIPMAWWNGPALITLGAALTIPFALLLQSWLTLGESILVFTAYYGAYEYFHWCMHFPKNRRLEFSEPFRRINGHHLLHHRYMGKNFNVVLPFADFCFGTLLARSKTHFKQATGPSVPNVQPLELPPKRKTIVLFEMP
jgi:hypothetical protein